MGVGGRWGGDGHLFEAGPLLTFSAFRMGDNSRLGAYSNKYGNSRCKTKFIMVLKLVILL